MSDNSQEILTPDDAITLTIATVAQKNIIANMMQLYLYDLSECAQAQLNQEGLFECSELDKYWMFSNHYPYLIYVSKQLAGFALLSEPSHREYELSEFFVIKAFRKKGIGQSAALELFSLFPGDWHVAHDPRNLHAQKFWRRTIRQFTEGAFEESEVEASPGRVEMNFCVSK